MLHLNYSIYHNQLSSMHLWIAISFLFSIDTIITMHLFFNVILTNTLCRTLCKWHAPGCLFFLSFLLMFLFTSALRGRQHYMIWNLSYNSWSDGPFSIVLRSRMDTRKHMGLIPPVLGPSPPQRPSRNMLKLLLHQ
jgi:hypothetical protein